MYIFRRQSKIYGLKSSGICIDFNGDPIRIQLITLNLDPGPESQSNADPDLDPAVTNGWMFSKKYTLYR